jgi:cytochrome c oxidase subunit 2
VSTRDEYYDVFRVYLPVAGLVFVLVGAALGVALFRGRRRTEPPSRRSENRPLEAGYALLLAAVAAGLLVVTLTTDAEETAAGSRGERVEVTAAKWHWRFDYPEYGIVSAGTDERPATLTVPRGTPIAFEGRSLDVIHALWIPQQRFQRQLFDDRVTRFTLTFDDETSGGTAPCAFFCGLGHKTMVFGVRVLEPDAFRDWVRSQ